MAPVRTILLAAALLSATAACDARPSVPFEIDRHRVVVPVSVAGSDPLRLILDTGMPLPGVLLFHEELIDSLSLDGMMDVLVPGAGDEEPSAAVMADSVTLRIGDAVMPGRQVVILQAERTQGFPTDGAIGAALFDHHLVEIDYGTMRLRLHEAGSIDPADGWTVLPVDIRRGLPWLDVTVDLDGETPQRVSVYIDLADDFPITLLTGSGRRFEAPADTERRYLGTGLSGDIHGWIGSVASVGLGPFEVADVRCAFAPATTRSKRAGADAVIGNGLLERFHIVFDYDGGRLLLKPNDRFDAPFDPGGD